MDRMPEGPAKKRLQELGDYKYSKQCKRLEVNQNGLDWKLSSGYLESALQVNARGENYGMLMYIFPSGHILQGVIKDPNTTGHMRQIYPDGTYYEGDWLKGCATGTGLMSVHMNQRNVESFMRKVFDKEPA